MKQRRYTHGGKVRADSRSGYRGVQSHRDADTGDERHQAYISDPVTKKRIVLGTYYDKKIAAQAHDTAAIGFYGEGAILNFPSKKQTSVRSGKKYIKKAAIPNTKCLTCDSLFYKRTANHAYCQPKCRPSTPKGAGGKFEVLHRDNFRCIYCGRAPWNTPDLIMHIDHIYPHAKGGRNTLSNLVTSCCECNVVKSATLIEDEEEILKIVENRNREKGLNPKRIIKLFR